MTSDLPHDGHHDPRGSLLDCRTEVISDCSVIHVSGEVDLATAPILERALAAAIGGSYPIVVDFAATRFIDSTGLDVLLRARRRHHQILAVAALPPTLRRVFELTKIEQTIPRYGTLAEALSALCTATPPSGVAGL